MNSLRISDALETMRGQIAAHLADQAHIIWEGAGYPTPAAIAAGIRDGDFAELDFTMKAIEDLVSGLSYRYLSAQSEQAYSCDFSTGLDLEILKRGTTRGKS